MSERSYAVKVFSDKNGPFFYSRDYSGYDFSKPRAPIKRFATLEEARAQGAREAPYSFEVVDFDEAENLDFMKDHLSHV